MKKLAIALAVTAAFTTATIGQVVAATVTESATATWSATAKKDATSKLVVVPLGSLSLEYAAGIGAEGAFNTQDGLFDVTIEGDAAATDFKLTSRLVNSTLTHLGGTGSTLDIGVSYKGQPLSKSEATTMRDTATATAVDGGNLNNLAFDKAGRTSAQDKFTFRVASATTDGSAVADKLSALPDGIWTGDVSVQFDAIWTTP